MDPVEQAIQHALVLRCQLGDQQALEELYLRHDRRMAYYLRRLLGRDDVDDVRQEVWLSVVHRIARLRHPEAFVVWLYRIARSHAMSRHGAAAQRPDASSASLDELPGDGPDDQAFTAEDAERIHRGLNQLPPEQREALVLRFMEDLSYEQIAEVTGTHIGTIRSRLHYAKQSLRRQLENES